MSDQNQELGNEGGVGAGAPTGERAVGEGTPTAPGSQPIAGEGQGANKVNLTELAEFRAYQANVDREKETARRREQALQQQLQTVQATQAAMAREFEQMQLKGAKPEQAVGYLQQQLAKERQEHENMLRQQSVATELQDRATKTLTSLGLDFDTPGLDFGDGQINEANYVRLLESALQVAGKRTGDEAARLKAETEEAARVAAQTTQVALARQMGATTVSTTTGPGAPPDDPFGGETDRSKRWAIALAASRKRK